MADGGHKNLRFHVGIVGELPLDDNTFNVAHCHAVLMHLPDTQVALAEVERVLAGWDHRHPRGDHLVVLLGAAVTRDSQSLGRVLKARGRELGVTLTSAEN